MGKNVIISTLPNISQNYLPKVNTSNIFANSLVYDDGSSVLINTTTASAYKLDVNGTGRFQGALTGTSATFSGSLIVGTGTTGTQYFANASAEISYSATTGLWRFNNLAGGSTPTTYYQFAADGTPILSILKSGAATFSSSVTATSAAFNTSVIIGNVTSLTGAWGNLTSVLQLGNTTTDKGYISVNEISGDDDINIVRYAYFDNTNWKRIGGGNPSRYYQRNAEHCFQYASSGADNTTITWNNALYISNSGNVGIGTTSPAQALHVLGGASPVVIASNSSVNLFTEYRYNTSTTVGYIGNGTGIVTGGGSGNFGVRAESALLFCAGGNAERMRITSGGDLWLGNDSNPYFEIANGGSTNVLSGIRWVIGSGRVNYGGVEMAASSADNGYMIFKTRNAGSTAERMRILSDGTSTLQITGATANNDNYPRLRFKGGTYPDADSKYPYIQLGNGGLALSIFGGYSATYNNPTQIALNNGVIAFFTASNSSTPVERMYISATGTTFIYSVYSQTSASAANVIVGSDGNLFRSTSSLKYKKDVVDYTKGLAEVMKLRPVNYQGKNEIDGDKIFAGLIAEEVHDLGLTEFVQYAEDGSPDALAYQNMVALLTKAIQELKGENDTLKADIESLKALINK